ncbi:hypothetical protein HFN_1080 [Helicobacter fennelliae MRY12-0050]|uniref:Uncharacterized protein n=1 Tax=Helicobacter fennelliae MRY12-0050 TaxID=1325130 RepID=T1D0V2_9HELI|nr:hypothetical protein HFN_1080 [Helicobacter fennelliae MRY12-0050]
MHHNVSRYCVGDLDLVCVLDKLTTHALYQFNRELRALH